VTATRRLAAILAADVAGYSRLMGEDEAGTALSVRAHREAARPMVARFGGRIVKTTGDGLLLEFPSVVASVECAIAIQKLMVERNANTPETKRIVYRIGVNLGDVLIEGDDILGDGVNIAARLEGVCEPGGVLISGAAYEHVRSRIDAEFVDLGEQKLKNIARPVRAYAVVSVSSNGAPARAKPAPAATPDKSSPQRLSLVVLPFANIGGDPEQEHFVDGVTESLTTDLSRIRGSFVIGRNTAFTYKDKRVDLRQIGRELNVRYVLEGSVQRRGNRMRVNVQLIDAERGNHLWAERFDKPLADLFDMQDEIVARLAGALNAELVAAEARRAEQAPSPNSMDLYFQGLASIYRGLTPDNMAQARSFFDRALIADPGNVDALVGSARVDQVEGVFFVTDRAAAFAAAEAKLTKALSAAPDHARGHSQLGFVYIYTERAAEGIAKCEHALALDRNLAYAHAYIGIGKIFIGRAEETEAHISEALRLSPRDTLAYIWMTFVGIAKLHLGKYEPAIACFRRTIEANRHYPLAYFHLAAALAQLGRLDEARSAVNGGLALNPSFTVSRVMNAASSASTRAIMRPPWQCSNLEHWRRFQRGATIACARSRKQPGREPRRGLPQRGPADSRRAGPFCLFMAGTFLVAVAMATDIDAAFASSSRSSLVQEVNPHLIRGQNLQAWFGEMNEAFIAGPAHLELPDRKSERYWTSRKRVHHHGRVRCSTAFESSTTARKYVETPLPLWDPGNITEIIVGPDAPWMQRPW
jgi:TolB-like protein/class 3 adenylate cyclase/Flp pilus assembly protein TadD